MPTHLPNPFLNSSALTTEDTAAASLSPPSQAAAELHSNSALERVIAADTDAAPHLTDPAVAASVLIDEPSSNEGRPKSAPALDAPNTHEHAGATDCISEIFHYARKLMMDHQGFVLDKARFLADIEEVPLFVRAGDHLRRWSA